MVGNAVGTRKNYVLDVSPVGARGNLSLLLFFSFFCSGVGGGGARCWSGPCL